MTRPWPGPTAGGLHTRPWNAQGLFRGRIDQLIAGGEPKLASVLVWRMETAAEDTDALVRAYKDLRAEIVDVLSEVDADAWWNRAHHEEFGTVTLAEQASYFANHEPTHLAQLADAMG